jgi:hypothetical protein
MSRSLTQICRYRSIVLNSVSGAFWHPNRENSMHFDPDDRLVTPSPIAWVTTLDLARDLFQNGAAGFPSLAGK